MAHTTTAISAKLFCLAPSLQHENVVLGVLDPEVSTGSRVFYL